MDTNPRRRHYDAAVVGAGISGLFAANFLAQRGLRVFLCDQSHQPGGCLTGIRRSGFYFDAGDQSFEQLGIVFPLLERLGLRDAVTFERARYRLVAPGIDCVIGSVSDLSNAFASAYPHERENLRALFGELECDIKLLAPVLSSEGSPIAEKGLRKAVAYARLGRTLLALRPRLPRLIHATGSDLAREHLTDPELREFIARIGYKDMNLLYYAGFLHCWANDYWYPKGGMQSFCDRMAERVRDRGGTVAMKTDIKEVRIEGGRATGVETGRGEVIHSDWVIYCGDHKNLFSRMIDRELLGTRFVKEVLAARVSEAVTSVYVGARIPPEELRERLLTHHTFYFPSMAIHDPDDLFDPDLHRKAWIEISSPTITDPSLAPPGCSSLVLQTMISADWRNRWETAGTRGKSAYRDLKRRVAEQMIGSAEAIIPGLARRAVWTDVGSPLSARRFTRNSAGATAGWTLDPKLSYLRDRFLSIETPIERLLTAGHYALWPGGVVSAALSGKLAADFASGRARRTLVRSASRLLRRAGRKLAGVSS